MGHLSGGKMFSGFLYGFLLGALVRPIAFISLKKYEQSTELNPHDSEVKSSGDSLTPS